ncbi:VOC family protein [Hymenobacter sp. GOD-10R]|uniref:VOC family protein n=1 Tax=Hymenobacter sp. GOD-10R TaxID=3093922 RepID=UPI002D7836C1|nr:VOC family protein [Hymenobacter sp. GOD-10R]WRQ31735.1 VOC family protein [Hymenobacter sp. GOD-10R]
MKIRLLSILVAEQEQALTFYTQVLGFIKKTDVPLGEHRWLTVVSPQERDGVELVLEPMAFAPARTYQQALFAAGIPLAAFQVENLQQEYERLVQAGVQFSMPPTQMGAITLAVLDDTCGNHLQLMQL